MTVIESFIKGKKEFPELCEDMLFVNEHFVAVVDGASSKTKRRWLGKTGGRTAAEKICETIKTFPVDISALEATEKMTAAVASLYDKSEPLGTAAASVVILSLHKKEIWSIGDCQCIINGEKFLHEKEIDSITANIRCVVLNMERLEGTTQDELKENDVGREFILPILQKQHIFANRNCKFGYGVINGTKVPENFIIIHKVCSGDTVVLASDGYPELCETLKESEKVLKETLNRDPLCYKTYISTKGIAKNADSFDDRTYIKVIV